MSIQLQRAFMCILLIIIIQSLYSDFIHFENVYFLFGSVIYLLKINRIDYLIYFKLSSKVLYD